MAYQVNSGIGAVASIEAFILDGFDADSGGGGGLMGLVYQRRRRRGFIVLSFLCLMVL